MNGTNVVSFEAFRTARERRQLSLFAVERAALYGEFPEDVAARWGITLPRRLSEREVAHRTTMLRHLTDVRSS